MMNNALYGVVGLAFWVIAARFSSAEDVGLASASVSAMLLVSLLATPGLDYALIRFLPASGKDANAMINSCLTISGFTSIALALIFILGLDLWSPALIFLRQNPWFFCAFVLFTTGWTIYVLTGRVFIAKRSAGYTLAQGMIFNITRLALVVFLPAFFYAFGIFASWGIATIVAFIIGAFLFLRLVQAGYFPRPTVNRAIIAKMMRFSLANYIVSLLWFAPTYILPLMVVNLLDAESNAYFYIAWSIASVLFSIPISASFSLFAEGSIDEKNLDRNAKKSLVFTLAIIIPAILVIVFLGDKILLLFSAAYSEKATSLLQLLALSCLPVSIINIYFGFKRAKMQMGSVIVLNTFMAISALTLSWVLIPRMGIQGAGIAWLSSQCLAASAIVLLGRLRRRDVHPM
jgi:O-antigen/teichoic acid export membrane protein